MSLNARAVGFVLSLLALGCGLAWSGAAAEHRETLAATIVLTPDAGPQPAAVALRSGGPAQAEAPHAAAAPDDALVTTEFLLPVPPLTLELTSSRELCTANTLTELSWEIAGGLPPYTLTIDGEMVDAAAESHRANCGPLPTDPFTNDPLPDPSKAFNAAVTDSQATPVTATAQTEVLLQPPLDAPANVRYLSHYREVSVFWDPVRGSGSQSPIGVHPVTRGDSQVSGVVRTRATDATQWDYHVVDRFGHAAYALEPTTNLKVFQVAAVRHPLEIETPASLNWSDEIRYKSTTLAQNVQFTSTHDSVTVSWNKQPYARGQEIQVSLYIRRHGGWRMQRSWEDGLSGRHEVTFTHLPPETDFTQSFRMVHGFGGPATTYAVSTGEAPSDWTPLPRGAQNLRTASAANGIVISWNSPSPSASDAWHLRINNRQTDRRAYSAFTHGATSWTVPLDRLLPETTYQATVEHTDFEVTATTVDFTTPPTGARRSAPPTLALTSSRELCTANTLTELSWEITGGQPPYALTIDGGTVDADAEAHRANCGPLPTDPFTTDPLPDPSKAFNATVSDSRGATVTASVAVSLAPPLAPPPGITVWTLPESVFVNWAEDSDEFRAVNAQDKGAGVVARHQAVGADTWTYSRLHRRFSGGWLEPQMGEHIVQLTAVRARIELSTPDALEWSEEQRFARPTAAENVVVSATHDSATVSWDGQPLAYYAGTVSLRSPEHHYLTRSYRNDRLSGRHEVVFQHLPPDTEYEVITRVHQPDVGDIVTNITTTIHTIRTATAPSEWQPPLRGPQNLRASATSNSITISWGPPFEGAESKYLVQIFERSTNTKIDSRNFFDGTMTWTTQGRYWRVVAGFSYRVHVIHRTIPEVEASVVVTAAIPGESRVRSESAAPTDPWEEIWTLPFRPI